jgi:hypothetical protein
MPGNELQSEYTITMLRARDQLEDMREEWQKLQVHPNSDIDLYLASFDVSPGNDEPCVAFVSWNGETVGLAAGRIATIDFPISFGYTTLFTVRRRAITVLPGAIQGDFPPEAAELLLNAFLELQARREVDVIRLVDIPADAPLAELARQRPNRLCRDHVRWSGRHWRLLLPDSSDAFFQSMKRKHRNALQKACALMDQENNDEGLSWERFIRPDQVDRFCQEADQIARKTYQRQLGASFATTESTLKKLRLLAERNQWRAYILYVHGVPAAYWIGTSYGTTFHVEYTGRDPAFSQFKLGTGTMLFVKMIEDICGATDIREVDFGFGDYPYKQRFGNVNEETQTLFLFAPTFSNVSLNMLRTALAWTEKGLAALLDRLGLRARINRFRRERLGRTE